MKLAVFGSRNITDTDFIKETVGGYLEALPLPATTTLLVGGAKGVQQVVSDTFSGDYNVVKFKPWHMINPQIEFSTALFFFRNRQIVDNSNRVLVVVKDGEVDSEVDKAVAYARKKGKQVDVITYTSGKGE